MKLPPFDIPGLGTGWKCMSPLVEELRGELNLAQHVPAILPFDTFKELSVRDAAKFFPRAATVVLSDQKSFRALVVTNQSFIAALKVGLEISGDLLEELVIRRSLGRVRYVNVTAVRTFEVTRFFEPIGEYRTFVLAMAENLEGWHPVDLDPGSGLFAHDGFCLWQHGDDSPIRNMNDLTAAQKGCGE